MEIELKFALSGDAAERLRAGPLARADVRELRSVYFDTEDHALRRAGYTLRVRETGGASVQGVKAAKGVARFEREVAIAGEVPDLAALVDTPAAHVVGDGPVTPVFESRVRRLVSTVSAGEGEGAIEVALDDGELISGASRTPIRELEMELKAGPPERLFEEAERWRAEYGLSVHLASKAERGYALADAEVKRAVKVAAIPISKETPAREAFAALAFAALTAFEANVRHVQEGDSLEAVHQARVALRRLRALVHAFRPVIDEAGRPAIEESLRAFAARFGVARDLDVFIAETFRPYAPHEPGAAAFGRRLLAAQTAARRELRAALCAGDADAFLLSTLRWVTVGAGADGTRAGDPTLGDLAPALLHKAWRRFRKRGKALDWDDPAGRHRLRIQAKKLRYLADALDDALPRRRGFDKDLRDFQDAAGRLNDLHMASSIARQALSGRASGEAAFAAGEIVGAARTEEARLIRRARKAYKALVKRGPEDD